MRVKESFGTTNVRQDAPSGRYTRTQTGDALQRVEEVKIWQSNPPEQLLNTERDGTLLATISTHQNGVNCVRWSPNGKYLASVSDDNTVMLCKQESGKARKQFGETTQNKENWVVKSVGRSHSAGLTWAPNSKRLATCSLDNRVIIWEVSSSELLEVKTTLRGHAGHVKGVAWDPIGTYLATHGDDAKVIIWSTEDGKKHYEITELLEEQPESYFRRLSWAPDGAHLFTTSGENNGVFLAPIISRSTWKATTQLIVNAGSVVCCASNPKVYEDKKTGDIGNVVALGTRDGCLSIWGTTRDRPVLVMPSVVDSILDLTWSTDGKHLFVASMEGSVVVTEIPKIGRILKDEEFQERLKSSYGEEYLRGGVKLVEDPAILLLSKRNDKSQNKPKKPVRKGTEVFVDIAETDGDDEESSSSSSASEDSMEEKEAVTTKPVVYTFAPSTTSTTPRNVTASKHLTPEYLGTNQELSNNAFTAPMVSQPTQMPPSVQQQTSQNGRASEQQKKRKRPEFEEEENTTKKRRKDTDLTELDKTPTKSTPRSRRSRPATNLTILDMPKIKDRFSKEIRLKDSHRSHKTFLEANYDHSSGTSSLRFFRQVPVADKTQKETTEILWTDSIRDKVSTCTTQSRWFIAIGCASGDIYIYCTSGRRLFPSFRTGNSPIAILNTDTQGNYLAAVSGDGSISLWNLALQEHQFSTSIAPLASSSGLNVTRVEISATGQVVVIVRTDGGQAYTWHSKLKVWAKIADAKSFRASEFNSSLLDGLTDVSGPLFHAQLLAMTSDAGSDFPFLTTEKQKKMDTISHLESQLVSSLALLSMEEYKKWLETYVRRLASDITSDDEPEFQKLDKLCRVELLGPMHVPHVAPTGTSPTENITGPLPDGSWNPFVLGESKRELLLKLLPLLSKNRCLGRLTVELKQSLEELGVQ